MFMHLVVFSKSPSQIVSIAPSTPVHTDNKTLSIPIFVPNYISHYFNRLTNTT